MVYYNNPDKMNEYLVLHMARVINEHTGILLTNESRDYYANYIKENFMDICIHTFYTQETLIDNVTKSKHAKDVRFKRSHVSYTTIQKCLNSLLETLTDKSYVLYDYANRNNTSHVSV